MSAKGIQGLTLAGEPRVQLMPPSIAARERTRRARSLAVLATILAIVVVGGAVTFAFLQSAAAAAGLEAARAETGVIQAQQVEYSPGRAAATAVKDTEEAITVVGTTDLLWAELFADITAALPAGTTIDQADVVARAPWEALLFPEEAPLRGPREVTIMLTLSSDNVLNPAAASRLLWATVPSLSDLYIYETQGETDKGRFLTKFELTLDSTALSGRYASDKLEELLERDSVVAAAAARDALDEQVRIVHDQRAPAGPATVDEGATPDEESADAADAEGADSATSEGSGQ